MRNRRKAIIALLAASACVLVLLVVFFNSLIEKNRERIREEIEKSLGRSVRFGELKLSFWGGIGLLAKRVSLAEDPRFAATPFIQARELRMEIRWLPLLAGNIAIKSFALEEPEIQIIRNEEGTLNLSALAASERRAHETKKESREPRETKKHSGLSLLPSALYVTKGKIDYIDRSFKEPVEIQVRNIKMDMKGRASSGAIQLRLSASLFGGQGENITAQGFIGPLRSDNDWSRQPVDLQLRLDSLLLPQLSRAVPFLRESLLPYLGMTGPLLVAARFLGTAERPRVSDLVITGAAFGADENNATVKGDLDFSKGNSWRDGEIRGSVVVDPTSLEYLKKIPFLRHALPSALTSEGPWSVTGELGGSLANLRARVLIKGRESQIRYGDWLTKPKGIAAEMEVRLAQEKGRLVFEESGLTLNNLRLQLSGWLEESPDRLLTLQLRSGNVDLSGWEKLLLPLSSFNTGGVVRWDLSVKKKLGLNDSDLDLRGNLSLDQLQAKDRKRGGGLEKMSARLSFRGKEARIDNGEGIWDGIQLSNLKGDLAWLPHGVSFKGLSLQALGGMLRANGSWDSKPDGSVRVLLEPNIEGMDLKELASHEFPSFKDHIEGQLNFRAKLSGEAKDGGSLKDNLQGDGAAQIRGGTLRDFNLVEKVLSKVTGLPGVPSLISARMPPRYSAVLQRKDTPFDTLAATFVVKQERIYSNDLVLATPDYSIHGQGWVGVDKTVKWDATLVMSPGFTQELLKEHRNVRYMLDRQGRLAVPFRLEGSLPYVQAKPDLPGLAEAIQRGLLRRGMERAPGGEKSEKGKTRQDWIQKGLEQLFGK